ncbi:dihydrolipoyl dehydrogenase [Cytobacillus gottheilii]|uniref:dihydrolipoyl dehydrogenase n=1 Tax=Cytobacillus gottheilii TaxID=859144 RepID=UPI0008302EF8|nr:dihydrolipoyl dehydrogenase [Cytobacillus gottheilii]
MKEIDQYQTGILIIGAGPGGYVAAIRAAQLGQKVTIVEKENLGGVCLNVGCIPSKALITASHHYHNTKHLDVFGVKVSDVEVDYTKVQAFKDGVVKKLTSGIGTLLKGNKVEIVKGQAEFTDTHKVTIKSSEGEKIYSFENAIIATGSRPVELPTMKFSSRILDSTGVLNLNELPKSMIAVGGGVIGVELVGALANFGVKVTILEGQKDILGGMDKRLTSIVSKGLKKKGVDILTNVNVEAAKDQEDHVEVEAVIDGEKQTLKADYLLVSVGRKPNTNALGLENIGIALSERGLIEINEQCQTSLSHIYAIGDIVPGPQLAHKASYEGKVAAEAISGHPAVIDYKCMPAVVFSEPEIAVVGHDPNSAKEKGIEAEGARFPFAVNGRAIALNETEGFVQLVTRKDNGVVIGGQIIGANASDMISELALAIESSLTAEDLALTVHPHPTLGEIVMEAAELATGNPIHLVK